MLCWTTQSALKFYSQLLQDIAQLSTHIMDKFQTKHN